MSVTETPTTEQRAAHTTGPWIVLAGVDLRDVGVEGVADDALIIASVTQARTNHENGKADVICDLWMLGFNGEADPTRRAEEEANARLIAAAPELLSALNGMVGLVQLIQFREPELQGNHRFVEALAVLAKAEGRDV